MKKEIESLTDKHLKYYMTKITKIKHNPPKQSKFKEVKERTLKWWREEDIKR